MNNIQAPASWHTYIEEWLGYLRTSAEAESTVNHRRYQISHLARGAQSDPINITENDLIAWFASKEYAPETRKSYRAAIRSYFIWMQTAGYRDDNPALVLPKVVRPLPHPRPCPEDYIRAALSRANAQETLMIRLGAEVGMRRDEISRVHSDDIIELIAGWGIIIQGKGRKQRTLTLPDDLAALIKDSNGFVFPGRFGGHASASYVGKHISQLLPDGWSGHKLRHRWAARGYEKTGDIYLVSAGLGHASVDTTMHYVPMPLDRMHELTEATRLRR